MIVLSGGLPEVKVFPRAIKRTRVRTTKWNLFFHYFTAVYAIISGIVLVPLYLHYIPLDLYGAWLAASNVIAWVSIVDPGLSSVVMQRVSAAYGQHNQPVLSGLITNGLLLSVLLAILVLTVGLFVSPFVFSILNLPEADAFLVLPSAFAVAVIGTAMMILSYGFTAINQGFQSSLGIGLIFVLTNLSSLALTVWLLVVGYGVMALPFALVYRGIGLSVGNAAYLVWRLRTEQTPITMTLEGFRDLVVLLSYTFWGKAVGGIANNLDALVITRFLGPEVAPVLLLTRKAPDLSRSVLERPAMAFMPAVANLYGTGNLERTRTILLRLFRMIIWLMGLASVGFLLLNGAFVNLWVGEKLFAGASVNISIVIGLVTLVLSNTLSNVCYALGNIKGNSLALLAESLIGIPLMVAGANYFGILGVAVAPTLAVLAVSSWYYPRTFGRLMQLGWDEAQKLLRELGLVAAAGVAAGCSLSWIQPDSWLGLIMASMVISIAYGACLLSISKAFRGEVIDLASRLRSRIIV